MSLNEDTMVDPLRTDAPADLMHRPMFPNEPPNLVLPAPILFKDYGMAVPKKEIDLGNWSLLDQVHALLSCTPLMHTLIHSLMHTNRTWR
jgi:hypothetical protein